MGFGQDSSQGGLYPQSGSNTIGGMVGQYETPIPNIANSYIKNLQQGQVNMPTFQEMYQSYSDVANQQAQRAGAQITEAFGSQGGRYSSDLLRAQGQNQRDLSTDLRAQAAQFQMGLRGQQSNEISGAVNYLGNRDVMGMQYLWQDYLRRTSPPPLLGAAGTQPGSPPGPVGF